MKFTAFSTIALSVLLVTAWCPHTEAANPKDSKQAQKPKKAQLRQIRTKAFADLPHAQRVSHLKKVVIPKLKTRISSDTDKIKSKDKLISKQHTQLAQAVNQALKAKQQLTSVQAQKADIRAKHAKTNDGPAALTKKLQKVNAKEAQLKSSLDNANKTIKHHDLQLRQLKAERKVHTDNLAKHLKQKRDGEAFISGKGVKPQPVRAQYGNSSFANIDRQYSRPPASAASASGQSQGSASNSVYGQLTLAQRPQQADGQQDQYKPLPNAALNAARGLVQARDSNGNDVWLPPAPPPPR
jgi:hypothetical protein